MDRLEGELAAAVNAREITPHAGPGSALQVAVIGAGWAGCAAAVLALRDGHAVTLFETAREPGGRARRVPDTVSGQDVDNGQHILIGAYQATLDVMRGVGVNLDEALWRTPLTVRFPDGRGLALPNWPAPWDAVAGLSRFAGWTLRERAALLATAARWRLSRFRCPAHWSVAQLTARLPAAVRRDFIDPLCVAALNTPAPQASATVFLRVLHDALLGGPGASHLLLPRQDLGRLFPLPALAWLQRHGAQVHLGHRVRQIQPMPDTTADATADGTAGWQVDGQRFDRVILACSASEAARLVQDIQPAWAACCASLSYEPIATVYAHGLALKLPMLALRDGGSSAKDPAQFVFDRSQLARGPGLPPDRTQPALLAFVVSGATPWVERGQDALVQAVQAQARAQLGQDVQPLRTVVEKRATFACTPGLQRPPMQVAPGLLAAADYVDGPYPATLEGAVRHAGTAVGRLGAAPDGPTSPS